MPTYHFGDNAPEALRGLGCDVLANLTADVGLRVQPHSIFDIGDLHNVAEPMNVPRSWIETVLTTDEQTLADAEQWFLERHYVREYPVIDEERANQIRSEWLAGDRSKWNGQLIEDEEWLPKSGWTDYEQDLLPADRKVQVSVYRNYQCYGGPEEGGWYYHKHEFYRYSERVYPQQIQEASDRLMALVADLQPRYPNSSVPNDGPELETLIEDWVGQQDDMSEPRPHYC